MDACFLCILRCLVHSSLRLRDQYLLSNACAILHNLALQLTGGLQPYTAERLVRVLCQMCVRAEKERSRAFQAGSSRAVPMYNPKWVFFARMVCFKCNRSYDVVVGMVLLL